MKNEKQLELVIMLNGNFCVIPIVESNLKEVTTLVQESMIKGLDDPRFFLNYGGYYLWAKHIVGFYVRLPVNRKTDILVDKLITQIDSESGDEGWKHSDE